jgi:uncharacterized protein YeaO (DUF488 family)
MIAESMKNIAITSFASAFVSKYTQRRVKRVSKPCRPALRKHQDFKLAAWPREFPQRRIILCPLAEAFDDRRIVARVRDAESRENLSEEGAVIRIKRVYDRPQRDDGTRFLVERLWPRGVKKDALRMDAWLKEAAPSGELRRWFAHDPVKWPEFRRRYFAELAHRPEAWKAIREAARRGNVTLLYSARDETHNNALALKAYLSK